MAHYPHFSVKELLLAMSLIAVGLSMLTLSNASLLQYDTGLAAGIPFGLWYAGGMFIGVGVMVPFNKALAGAWIALFLFSLYELRF